MIFVYYVPQHNLHGLCKRTKTSKYTSIPFPFHLDVFRISYVPISIFHNIYVYMSVNFFNYFNGIFCCIGNFKSFRFYQQYIACSALNFLKVFSGFSPLQWSAAKLSKRFDDEMCFPAVNTFCCHVWNLCQQKTIIW